MSAFDSSNPETRKQMRDMFGPGQVDSVIRQAIQICWMMLPEDRKTVDEVENQFRRLVDRALVNLRDDSDAFGVGK